MVSWALCVLQSPLREALQALSNYLEGRLLPVLTHNWMLLQDWVPPQRPPYHRLTDTALVARNVTRQESGGTLDLWAKAETGR